MRLDGPLAVAVLALVLLGPLASPAAGAEAVPIPGTNLQVIELGAAARTVSFGGTANFSWGVYNSGPQPETINVTAASDDPEFLVELFPTDLAIPRGVLATVGLNVSAPQNGFSRTATIHVNFTTVPFTGFLVLNVTLTARATPASVDLLTVFAAVGAIIAIGFTASLIFERTRIPDLLILIFLGLILGPVAALYLGITFVDPGVLAVATPYFTAVALMFILFDGGLNLRLKEVVRKLGVVGLHTGVTFILTLFGVAFVGFLVLGYPWLVALLLGTILGGTSGAVVIGIVRALRVSEDTKIILTLESVITDVLCVVTVLALIELLRGGPGASVSIVFADLGQAFAVSLVFGLAAGVAWLALLQRVEKKPFSYMLTIAVLFVLYSFSEVSGGSGAMSSFVFGLVLGNHVDFAEKLRMRARFVIDDRIKQFHAEFAFVIRTFFFVFLGIVFTFDFAGTWDVSTRIPVFDALDGTFLLFLVGVVLIFLVIAFVRMGTARIITFLSPKPGPERRILWSLMGRGLAAAVLATLPFTIPAFTDPATAGEAYYRSVLAPYESQFLNIAFFIILLTVSTTTVGVVASERALGRAGAARPTERLAIPEILRDIDLDSLQVYHEPPRRPG